MGGFIKAAALLSLSVATGVIITESPSSSVRSWIPTIESRTCPREFHCMVLIANLPCSRPLRHLPQIQSRHTGPAGWETGMNAHAVTCPPTDDRRSSPFRSKAQRTLVERVTSSSMVNDLFLLDGMVSKTWERVN